MFIQPRLRNSGIYVMSLAAQSCLTLCDPMGCSLPHLCPWDTPGQNTGVGCHALLQGIFPTQGSNPGIPQCRRILHHLSHHELSLNTLQSFLWNRILEFLIWIELSGGQVQPYLTNWFCCWLRPTTSATTLLYLRNVEICATDPTPYFHCHLLDLSSKRAYHFCEHIFYLW